MLDLKLIRNATATVAQALSKRGVIFDMALFNRLEEQRKQLQMKMQELQNERNVRSKAVGVAKATGQDVAQALENLKTLSDELKTIEDQFAAVQTELDHYLAQLPNLPHDSVPVGKSDADNQLIRTWGEPTQFSFTPKDHIALGATHQLMDFETAAKISGARFVVLRGALAKLQRALIQFMLDLHTQEHGYQEIAVPYLVNSNSLFGTSQLPKMKEDLFGFFTSVL